jgi:hypothetical protein
MEQETCGMARLRRRMVHKGPTELNAPAHSPTLQGPSYPTAESTSGLACRKHLGVGLQEGLATSVSRSRLRLRATSSLVVRGRVQLLLAKACWPVMPACRPRQQPLLALARWSPSLARWRPLTSSSSSRSFKSASSASNSALIRVTRSSPSAQGPSAPGPLPSTSSRRSRRSSSRRCTVDGVWV